MALVRVQGVTMLTANWLWLLRSVASSANWHPALLALSTIMDPRSSWTRAMRHILITSLLMPASAPTRQAAQKRMTVRKWLQQLLKANLVKGTIEGGVSVHDLVPDGVRTLPHLLRLY